jgi:hypothetical protein
MALSTSGMASFTCRLTISSFTGVHPYVTVGVITNAALDEVMTTGSAVGNYQSFALASTGKKVHNRSFGQAEVYTRALKDGDLLLAEINHNTQTISFAVNGASCGIAFRAGDPSHGPRMSYHDGQRTIVWPTDGLFFPAVSFGRDMNASITLVD